MGALTRIADAGLVFAADATELVVTPSERITDALRVDIRANKPALLAVAMSDVTLAELRELAGGDWLELEANPALLEAFAHAVATRKIRERGEIPSSYTTVATCAQCGPVWLWKGCPSEILACPWCWNKTAGKHIPSVTALESA